MKEQEILINEKEVKINRENIYKNLNKIVRAQKKESIKLEKKEKLFSELENLRLLTIETKDGRALQEVLLLLIKNASETNKSNTKYIEELVEKYGIEQNTRDCFEKWWYYKWYVENISEDLNYTKEKVLDELHKIKKVFEQFNDEKGYSKLSFDIYFKLGMQKEMKKSFEELLEKKDEDSFLSDCNACIRHSVVYQFMIDRNYLKGYEAAQDLLSGELTCGDVPQETYPMISLIYEKIGKKQEAEDIIKKVNKDDSAEDLVEGLTYFLVKKEEDKALEFLSDRMKAWEEIEADEKFFFVFRYYFLVAKLFEKISEKDKKKIKIKIPKTLPIYDVSNKYNPEELKLFYKERLKQILLKINKRNENDFFENLSKRYDEIIG